MTADHPTTANPMPALESIGTLCWAIAGAAGATLLAGMATDSAATIAQDAAATAEVVKQLTDDYVLLYSFAGALSSFMFGFLPGSPREGAAKALGSAQAAIIFCPLVVMYLHLPPTVIWLVPVGGVIGLTSYVILLKTLPLLSNIVPEGVKSLFRAKGIDTSDYDVGDDRPRARKPRNHDDLGRGPIVRKPRFPRPDDDQAE